ncbi:MAG: response regulator [Lachnospiraceae bacterium]|nr:response regulator [Lachnospiraceae bacterium]
MRAIIVDDEPLMITKFMRLSAGLPGLSVVGQFQDAETALAYAKENRVDVAFLDVELPVTNGIVLAKKLRKLREDIIIVFVTAYDEYIRDSNMIGGDYYVVKPYTREVLVLMMEKLEALAARQKKPVRIRTFGRFTVMKDGKPVPLVGKAKEILALVVTRRGKEISNEEIYSTLWEGRPYSNVNMSVYYNALRRLRAALKKAGLEGLLVRTPRGQMVDTRLFDCDYYDWKDGDPEHRALFEGEFLPEYSWGEYILAEIVNEGRD